MKQGYGTALPESRYPAFVLHLSIPAQMVDINVHPQKREVRFRQEALIKEFLAKTIQNALQVTPRKWSVSPPAFDMLNLEAAPVSVKEFTTVLPTPFEMRSFPQFEPQSLLETKKQPYAPLEIQQENPKPEQFAPHLPMPDGPLIIPTVIAMIPQYIILSGSPNEFLKKYFPNHALGGFLLVDQKSAHARVIFDALTKHKENEPLPQQILLVPYQMRLSPHEAALLRRSLEILQAHGISIRESGSDTFLIDAIPQVFGNSNVEQLFTQMLSDLNAPAFSMDIGQRVHREIEKKLAVAASKTASTAILPLQEAQELIKMLVHSSDPCFSPSGKRIIVYLSAEEISKQFQRMV